MTTAEQVYSQLQLLPETAQRTVLDFVEFLAQKQAQDELMWSTFSVASALRGLEEDEWPEYTEDDFKERCS